MSLFEFQVKVLTSWSRIFSAERGFVAVHVDGKEGYSLSNWPQLEAKELNPEDGLWKPSRIASAQIQKIFLASPGDYEFEYVRLPRFDGHELGPKKGLNDDKKEGSRGNAPAV